MHFGWSALHLAERWSLSRPHLDQAKSGAGGRGGIGSSSCTAEGQGGALAHS